jgi:cytoskeletal protein CcmA (bactofilin family)
MFGSKDVKETKETTPAVTTRERIERSPDRTAERPIASTTSVIGEKVSLNGTLNVEGNIVINGQVEGSVTCTGQLTVGKTGKVRADLEVGSIVIGGWVEGKVHARERVELQTESHLKGDVHAKSFVIQDGCFFQGNCIMGEAAEPRSRVAPVSEARTVKAEAA